MIKQLRLCLNALYKWKQTKDSRCGEIPRLRRSGKTWNKLKSRESHPTDDLLHRSRGGGKGRKVREGLYPVRNGGRSLRFEFRSFPLSPPSDLSAIFATVFRTSRVTSFAEQEELELTPPSLIFLLLLPRYQVSTSNRMFFPSLRPFLVNNSNSSLFVQCTILCIFNTISKIAFIIVLALKNTRLAYIFQSIESENVEAITIFTAWAIYTHNISQRIYLQWWISIRQLSLTHSHSDLPVSLSNRLWTVATITNYIIGKSRFSTFYVIFSAEDCWFPHYITSNFVTFKSLLSIWDTRFNRESFSQPTEDTTSLQGGNHSRGLEGITVSQKITICNRQVVTVS